MLYSNNSTERFSNRVENYVRYRPGYPVDLINYLYTKTGFSKESVIADIGSGTGILTGMLLEKGSRVVGVEPNKEMRKAAEKLLEEYPRFVSWEGTAEKTGLTDRSFDYIVCAQAFHWFDRVACKKEFSRILKDGGKTVLVWNKRIVEENGFSAEYENLLKAYANDYNEVDHKLVTDKEIREFFKGGAYDKALFENEQLFDFEGLKGRLLSSSYSPMPGERNYDILMAKLEELFITYCNGGKVAFKYQTEAYAGQLL